MLMNHPMMTCNACGKAFANTRPDRVRKYCSEPCYRVGRRINNRQSPPPPPVPGALWIPLTKGMFALIDEQDASLANEGWCYVGAGYARSSSAREYLHHRLLGNPPHGFEVDHRNRNKLDNRRENLRFVSHGHNMANAIMPKRVANPMSDYRGVRRNQRGGKWKAVLANTVIGASFVTPEEAARAYDAAARQRYGDCATCNFPEES